MYKQKIGISLADRYCLPMVEILKMLKQIGFDAVSPNYCKDNNLEEIITQARNSGLEIQSLHAPFGKAADMWSADGDICTPALNELLDALQICRRFDIPVLVVHSWIGFDYTFSGENLNFTNFDKLVDAATEYGVKIAFENTEGEEYLFALMDHFCESKTVGFCWDSGHEMCYNHSKDLLCKYGDRLIITHLNDNLGISRFDGKTFWTDDLHLLPYDGVADWDYNTDRLKNAKKLDILNFELAINSKPNRHENDIYSQMDIRLYFTEAYKRACKIAFRYSK